MAMEIQRLHVHILIVHDLQATDQWRPLNSGTIGPKKNTMRGDNMSVYIYTYIYIYIYIYYVYVYGR